MRIGPTILTVIAVGLLAADATAKTRCKSRGKAPQVFVRAKTPVRRGPGLNYPVFQFLQRGRCYAYSEVSSDHEWVLVETKNGLGWVDTDRLAPAHQARIRKVEPGAAPVGSGQTRAFVRTREAAIIREAPMARAKERGRVPAGTRFVPLTVTEDELWVQVRDDRGDVGWLMKRSIKERRALAKLPRTRSLAQTVTSAPVPVQPAPQPAQVAPAASEEPPKEVWALRDGTPVAEGAADPSPEGSTASEASALTLEQSRPAPPSEGGIGLTVQVLGSALMPVHSLDSDGATGVRRYDLTAFSPGAFVELEVTDLGPLTLRANYSMAFLSGLAADATPNLTVGGTQHEATGRLGLPLDAGAVLITPEIGYLFGQFTFDPLLPGEPVGQFLSTTTHAGTIGGRVDLPLGQSVLLCADLAVLVGVTQETPFDLGQAGTTMGGLGSLSAQYWLSSRVGLAVSYGLSYRRTGFSGPAALDETITAASLVDLTHGLSAGVAFAVGG